MIRTAVVVGRNRAPRRLRPRWAALLALLLLAGCQRASETEIGFAGSAASNPVAAADAPARFTTSEFIATDGAHLPLRHWLPADGVKAVILALHGFGDYGNAFEAPAQLWAARGIATYAFDQRGFGGAPGRGLWAGEGWLTLDAVTASRILRRLYPGRPLYILGESMGGAVAVLAATGAAGGTAAEPDGVILSAPALWGRATMGLLPRIALFAGVRLFPDMILTGQGLHIRASDNIPMLKALAKDPMVLKEARVDTVYGLVDMMDAALAAAPRLTAPTLFMYGAHDEVIPRPPIEDFVAHLPPDPGHVRRLAYYPEGYHMLLRDLDGATVAGDVASWILDRGARLPSRADAAESAQPWPPPPDSNG
ncbi:MAG: alpha/beta fold hydrolase [Alphaproteobacteria bacterium]